MSPPGPRAPSLELAASVETLWRDPEARSRNRHFDHFADPRHAHARRIVMFLLDLRVVLRRLSAGAVRIVREETGGRVRVSYRDRAARFSRVVFLADWEMRLLAEDPGIAHHLGGTGEEAAP